MKHNRVIAGVLFVLFMVVIMACGGGGPGSNNTNGTTSGNFTSIRLEAVQSVAGTTVDPSNIFVNEQIQFRLTGLDDTLNRVVIPTSGFSLTGSPGGSLDGNGLFVANSSPSGTTGTVKINFDGFLYSTIARVVTPEAIIQGTGRTTDNFPARGIQIQALNAGGAIVATGLIASDGTIRMSAPTTAVRFTTNFSLVDNSTPFYYARQFAYAGKDYSTIITDCTAPLPALTNGSASNLLTAVVFYRNSGGFPPPPPDGCQ